MTDDERRTLGALVTGARRARFGTKRNAYGAAGLNAATWDRIEAGERVKDYKLAPAVKALWPETGGDWRRIPAETTAPPDVEHLTDDELLDALRERMRRYAASTTNSVVAEVATSEVVRPPLPSKATRRRPGPDPQG